MTTSRSSARPGGAASRPARPSERSARASKSRPVQSAVPPARDPGGPEPDVAAVGTRRTVVIERIAPEPHRCPRHPVDRSRLTGIGVGVAVAGRERIRRPPESKRAVRHRERHRRNPPRRRIVRSIGVADARTTGAEPWIFVEAREHRLRAARLERHIGIEHGDDRAARRRNAEIRGADVIYRRYYDIGIAVGSGRGLVVPVLRNAEQLSFADIETAIADFAGRARAKELTMDDLQGGTFTITNGGVYGSLLSTPIINPPQSGILGLHAIQDRPVARDGQVVIRPMMYVALTYDHRIVDGREAVTFLKHVKACIEEPARMLLDI